MLNFAHTVAVLAEDLCLYRVHRERARFMVAREIAKVASIGGKKKKLVFAIQLSQRLSELHQRPQRRNGEAGDFCTAASVRHIDITHAIVCCEKADCCMCGGSGFRTDKQRALGYEPKPIHSDDSWAFVPSGLRDPAAA